MFFSQDNLVNEAVTPVEEPWKIELPADVLDLPKDEYKNRWRNPATRWYLLSLVEGQNSDFIVSSGNQAKAVHGFFADYDGMFTEDMIAAMSRRRAMYPPAYWCLSQSRQLHLVWLFERPVAVTGNLHACDLLHSVAVKVKAAQWGVGYDPDSEKATQVMDIGREWHEFKPNARIPMADLMQIDVALFEKSAKKYTDDAVKIPFDELVPELRAKYPDMPADFHEGTRCRRFWDAAADNPTACLVRAEGIVVFTPHDNGFKSWPSLVGREFCDHYTAKSMAPFYEDTFYIADRDTYVRFRRASNPPVFEARKPQVLKRDLMIEAGLSDKRGKDGSVSEVENAMWVITSRNSVDYAAPMIYRPAGKIATQDGGTALNTSLVTVLKPVDRFPVPPADEVNASRAPDRYRVAPDTCAWDNEFAVSQFPNIYRFVTTLFLPAELQRHHWEAAGYPVFLPEETESRPWFETTRWQIDVLLSWLAYWYRNAARMVSLRHPGQALFLAGDVGRGKSFFARELLGRLMGGYTDADKFYIDGARFTDGLLASPVHIVDDRLGSADRRLRVKFSESLKTVVANAELRYEKKFGDSRESVPWAGRVVTLCNKDPQALSVLPDLDMSTNDKFTMLMCGTAQFPFGDRKEETIRWLTAELPYFARFLLGWRTPAYLADDRYGVKAWQHPDMRQASAENGYTMEVVEALSAFFTFARQAASPDETTAFVGTVSQLYRAVAERDESFARSLRGPAALRQQLRILQRSGGYVLTENTDTNPAVWTIPYDFVVRR